MARKLIISAGHGGTDKYYIYTLSSSKNPEIVRYVGITNNLTKRYNKHIHSFKHSNRKVTSWIKNIVDDGYDLTMTEIDTAFDINNANSKEVNYIKLYKSVGCNLKNLTNGGDGVEGCARSPETRLKISINNKRNNLGKRKYDLKDSDVKDLFLKNLNNNEIAKILNVPSTAVKESRKRLGLFYEKGKIKNINKLNVSKEELTNLYLTKNLNKREIADIYNCSQRTIKKYLVLYKIYKYEKNHIECRA
jgi:transposase